MPYSVLAVVRPNFTI